MITGVTFFDHLGGFTNNRILVFSVRRVSDITSGCRVCQMLVKTKTHTLNRSGKNHAMICKFNCPIEYSVRKIGSTTPFLKIEFCAHTCTSLFGSQISLQTPKLMDQQSNQVCQECHDLMHGLSLEASSSSVCGYITSLIPHLLYLLMLMKQLRELHGKSTE